MHGSPQEDGQLAGLVAKDGKLESDAIVKSLLTPTRRLHNERGAGIGAGTAATAGVGGGAADPEQVDGKLAGATSGAGEDAAAAESESELLNAKAVTVIGRVENKLTGRDFAHEIGAKESKVLTVQAQVERLLRQATSHANLCQCYIGWCPFW